MLEKLLSPDAFVSYFSTTIGIIITVILIPIVMSIYTKRKNSHKKLLAEKILMTKINNRLEKLVPNNFRTKKEGNLWFEKKYYRLGIISIAHTIPFSIKYDNIGDMEEYFTKELKSSKSISTLLEIQEELIDTRKDLEAFLYTYGEVFNKKMFREFYILDYNIQTCECNPKNRDELSLEAYAETIMIVINVLDRMRRLILKQYIVDEDIAL